MLSDEYLDTASLWHYERNYPLTPQEVTSSSSQEVWWNCQQGVMKITLTKSVILLTVSIISIYPHT